MGSVKNEPYFHPKLEIENEHLKCKVLNLIKDLNLTKQKIYLLREQLCSEIVHSLQTSDSELKSLPMYNTFVHKFPTGKESGEFLGIDIGGTNLRVLSLSLNINNEKEKITLENFPVPLEYRQGKSKIFFDYLAKCIGKFLDKHLQKTHTNPIPMGFTFSFGYEQLSIDRGRCVQFGIFTNLPDAIGKCPVELLQNSIDELKLPVKIVALANDSTNALIYGKYLDPDTKLSLILGSGSNIAYVEKVEEDYRIKNPNKIFGCSPKEFIINSEYVLYGDFNQMDFIKSRYDYELDAMSLFPNNYTFEKMIGGAFLGELFRLVLMDLIRNQLILKGKFSPKIVQPKSISTADMSLIEKELISSNSYNEVDSLLINRLGYSLPDISINDRQIIAYVCQIITIRCSILCAVVLASFVDHVMQCSKDVIKICSDGTLYKEHPKIDYLINSYLHELIPSKKIKIFLAENGSCIGAALLAACVQQ